VPNDFNQSADIFALNLYPSNSIAPFRIDFLPVAGANQILTWPVTPGRTYVILSKTNLVDPAWQTITGQMTLVGNRAYFSNSTAAAPQRFYRVIAN